MRNPLLFSVVVSLTCIAFVSEGCSCERPSVTEPELDAGLPSGAADGGGLGFADAGPRDAAVADSGLVDQPGDAGIDAGAEDSGLFDAGPADAGDGDAGPADAGAPEPLSGRAWAQLADGRLIRLDLATGDISWPLTPLSASGGVTERPVRADGGIVTTELVFYVPTLSGDPEYTGRLVGYRPEAPDDVTPLAPLQSAPPALAVNETGDRVVLSPSDFGSAKEGAIAEGPIESVGVGAAAFDRDTLVLASEYGLRYIDDTTFDVWNSGLCTAIAYDPSPWGDMDTPWEGSFLCGRSSDDWNFGQPDVGSVARMDPSGQETSLLSTSGRPYRSVTPLSRDHAPGETPPLHGYFVAVRSGCTVETNSSVIPDLSALCPYQFVERDGQLFFSEEGGGILSLTPEGPQQHIGAPGYGGGLAVVEGRIAVGGASSGSIRRYRRSFLNPSPTEEFETPLGVALDASDVLYVLDVDGLHRVDPQGGSVTRLAAVTDGTAVALFGGALLIARGANGVARFHLETEVFDEDLGYGAASLVAACPSAWVWLDESGQVHARGGDDHTFTVGGPLPAGEFVGLGCVEDQVLLSDSDGGIWGRHLEGGGAFTKITEAPAEVWHFSASGD